MTDREAYAGAILVGAMAGLRSMSAPTLVSHIVPGGALPAVKAGLAVLAAGEAIADKLPFMPSRTKPVPLLGRGLMGAISGGALCASRKRSAAVGALLGAAAAIGAAFAAYNARKTLSRRLPDFVVALAEDSVVAGAGLMVARTFGAQASRASRA